MYRPIDAESINKSIIRAIQDGGCCDCAGIVDTIKDIISTAPTIIQVKAGEWIDDSFNDCVICPVCGMNFNIFDNQVHRFKYCPNCGVLVRLIDKNKKQNE